MAMSAKMRKNDSSESTWLNSMQPTPKITVPSCRIARGPKRSAIQPWRGPSRPLSTRVSAKASETTVALQPNSACMSTM